MRAPVLATALVATLAFAGCSSSGAGTAPEPSLPAGDAATGGPHDTPSSKTSPATPQARSNDEPAEQAIQVRIAGDDVSPNGLRVEVQAGEPVRLAITSDRPGELHVHSSPEQTMPFDAGRSVVTFSIDTPGLVDVEEHESHTVVLQLEVR